MKKIYSCMLAMTMALAANATDYYLIGGFNNWILEDPQVKFELQDDGNYTLDYDGTLTSGFKINDGTWSNDEANFGGSEMLVLGETYDLQVGGSSGNIPLTENVENPHMVFNPIAKTLLVTGEAVATDNIYGIHGDIFGDPSWSTENMTLTDGKWVLADRDVNAGNFGIKIIDRASGNQTGWIASAGVPQVYLNTPIACEIEGTNFSIAAGTYTFTFDPEAMTLLIVEAGEEPEPDPDAISLYLRGGMNDWGAVDDWKFTTTDNIVFTLSNVSVAAETEFKIADAFWGEYNYGGNQVWLGYESELIYNGANLILMEGGEDLTFTFNLENLTLVITDPTHPAIDMSSLRYGVKGNIFGDPNWSIEEMSLVEDNWVLADAEIQAGFFGIAVLDAEGTQLPGSPGWYACLDGQVAEFDKPLNMGIYGYNLEIGEGKYTFTFNPEAMTLLITPDSSGVNAVEAVDSDAVYYNLQGVGVNNPTKGTYIKISGDKVSKVIIK